MIPHPLLLIKTKRLTRAVEFLSILSVCSINKHISPQHLEYFAGPSGNLLACG